MRKIVVLVVGTFILASVYLAEAQQTAKSLPRIGFIASTGPHTPGFNSFQLGLRDLGYVDGTNVVIVHRYAEGKLNQIPALVNELIQQKVNVIVAPNNV